jgi:micrococcal nuclease
MELKPIILATLFVISGVIYYSFTDGSVGRETFFVEEVLDGDTLKLEDGRKVRLLGINAPESSMLFNKEATEFLRNEVGDKEVGVESYGVGKYGRTLAYVFVDDVNVNGVILSRGLGTLYYYERDGYYD